MSVDERQKTELVTHLETEEGAAVDPEATANLMLAEAALLADINKRYAADKALVWGLRPFREGSFEIVFEIFAAAAPLLTDSPLLLATFKALKEFFSLKCRLAGRKYSITGNNVIIVEGGEGIQVSPVEISLLTPDGRGSIAAEKAFDSLARDKTISAVGFYRAREDAPFVTVDRAHFSSFRVPEAVAETREVTRRALVGIRQPSFEADLVWRLLLDGFKIQARMADEGFLKRSTGGDESFNQRDHLDVTLIITQEQSAVTGHWENSSFVVERVWEHIRPAEHLPLESDGEAAPKQA